MKEGDRRILESVWWTTAAIFSSFPENSLRLINSQEEHFSLSLSPSHHPSDRPPSCQIEAKFVLIFVEKEKERKWNGLVFHSFILLLSFSFFVCFFSRRRAIHHDGGEQQQKPKLRRGRMIYLFPLLHFLPPFFTSSLLFSLSLFGLLFVQKESSTWKYFIFTSTDTDNSINRLVGFTSLVMFGHKNNTLSGSGNDARHFQAAESSVRPVTRTPTTCLL